MTDRSMTMVQLKDMEGRIVELERRQFPVGLNERGRPFASYLMVGVRDTLPTADVDFKDQLTVLRGGSGVADTLYVCREDRKSVV